MINRARNFKSPSSFARVQIFFNRSFSGSLNCIQLGPYANTNYKILDFNHIYFQTVLAISTILALYCNFKFAFEIVECKVYEIFIFERALILRVKDLAQICWHTATS